MCQQAIKFMSMAIVDYMAGNKKYIELANRANEFNKQEPQLIKCKYKVNGTWVKAKVNFSNGVIIGLDGSTLRRCLLC